MCARVRRARAHLPSSLALWLRAPGARARLPRPPWPDGQLLLSYAADRVLAPLSDAVHLQTSAFGAFLLLLRGRRALLLRQHHRPEMHQRSTRVHLQ